VHDLELPDGGDARERRADPERQDVHLAAVAAGELEDVAGAAVDRPDVTVRPPGRVRLR
jgi:hypothetical protein